MKNTLSIFLLAMLSKTLMAQNLVPNPSFEDTLFCPHFNDQMNACLSWNSYGNSPDYFNACDGTGLNVPNSQFGFQYAHSGKAFAGIATYVNPNTLPNYREFIGVQLINNLQVGQKYYLSFYSNHSGYGYPFQYIGANKVGMRFSSIAFDSCCPPPINNYAHLYTDSIISDTISWYKIFGSFIADSAYSFLTIGNFFDDSNTDTLIFGNQPFGGVNCYLYIDDVCVSLDSTYCENWTHVNDITFQQNDILAFPNPTSKSIKLKSKEMLIEVDLISLLGEPIFKLTKIKSKESEIDIKNFADGFYILSIKTEKRTLNKLFVIKN